MKKKYLTVISILGVFLMFLAACSDSSTSSDVNENASSGKVTTVSISTGGTTGMYFTTHAPIAEYINENSKMIRVVPTTSGGSTENKNNVINGVSELGAVYNDEVLVGYEENDKLRFVGPTTGVSPLQFVVKADSGINTLEDLKGKKVHIGASGSGARNWAHKFFEWAGIIDEVTEVPLGNEDAVTGLGDDVVSMITVGGLAPSARVTEASVTNDIRLLDLSPYLDDFLKEFPYFEIYTIPSGTYEGIDYEVKTFGLATSIVTMEDMDDEILTEYMTWAYNEEAQKAALTSNPIGPNHNPEDPLANAKIPLHPAAAKFWESKGFTVPNN
ncbi:TAXI family TRAP transporter solute-binding subunit [Bacillus timonensis]|uniref:TAXI family TRAP transporter solute-binding subunit n=1 Tax=Bacillus timonensis TaxID=1033734 RepID=A0A4S3PKI8_9BACI|nr:TAXI family TRAP transporter solute-binding subunit [Bacillus timonensis]THE09919.1 TAXI family TRAP transporter solute-binding subunit [Bacillus timonensis]